MIAEKMEECKMKLEQANQGFLQEKAFIAEQNSLEKWKIQEDRTYVELTTSDSLKEKCQKIKEIFPYQQNHNSTGHIHSLLSEGKNYTTLVDTRENRINTKYHLGNS